MSTTIKYRGSTIATMNDTASKTLQTKGKYCSDDIIVENVQDGVGNHGYKEWDVVINDAITTAQKYVFVTDNIVAEHYADDTALASFFCTKDVS